MTEFVVRPATPKDARAMAELLAVVAQERDGIASEPPVDVDDRAVRLAARVEGSFVAVAAGHIVGTLNIEASRHGYGDIGMLVERGWRGRGVGSALLRAGMDWARGHGLHKLCLEVFPHNSAAIGLYRRCGFVEEGRRIRQYRRANGELWDAIMMGRELQG